MECVCVCVCLSRSPICVLRLLVDLQTAVKGSSDMLSGVPRKIAALGTLADRDSGKSLRATTGARASRRLPQDVDMSSDRFTSIHPQYDCIAAANFETTAQGKRAYV